MIEKYCHMCMFHVNASDLLWKYDWEVLSQVHVSCKYKWFASTNLYSTWLLPWSFLWKYLTKYSEGKIIGLYLSWYFFIPAKFNKYVGRELRVITRRKLVLSMKAKGCIRKGLIYESNTCTHFCHPFYYLCE